MLAGNIEFAEIFYALMERMRKIGISGAFSGIPLLSPAQMVLLDLIANSDGCGVQDIADRLKLSPPTVSVGVRRLESADLITRSPNPQDKRAIKFSLTEKGRETQAQSQHSRRKKMEVILTGLDSAERGIFLKLLEKAITSAEIRQDTFHHSDAEPNTI